VATDIGNAPRHSSGQVQVRATLVHALNEEARQFYLRYDFEPSPTDDLYLFLLIKDAQEMVDRITSH
jgi:hypothetical protein